jgi:uncharacterized delta-60 repeat protein
MRRRALHGCVIGVMASVGVTAVADAHVVTRALEFGGYDSANAVVAGPGATFIVAGSTTRGRSRGEDVALARMRLDGSVDPGFGDRGRVVLDFGSRDEDAWSIARDASGRILLVGSSGDSMLAARLLADGRLDRSFGGGDGAVKLSPDRLKTDCAGGLGVRAAPPGAVVVTGFSGCGGEGGDGFRLTVVRLTADGRLDRTFSRDGIWQTGSSCTATEPLVQTDGAIVVGGSSGAADYCGGGQMRVLRVTADGRLDRTFGRDGRSDIRASRGGDSGVRDLASDALGRIVVAGYADGAGRTGFAAARLSPSGQLDPQFGVLRGPSLGGRTGFATSVALTASGQPVLAGLRSFGRDRTQFVVARYARGRGRRQIIAFHGRDDDLAMDVANVDGRIVAVGSTRPSGRDTDVALAILS